MWNTNANQDNTIQINLCTMRTQTARCHPLSEIYGLILTAFAAWRVDIFMQEVSGCAEILQY